MRRLWSQIDSKHNSIKNRYADLLFRENKHRISVSKYTSPIRLTEQLERSSKEEDALAKCHATMDRIREYLQVFDEKWGARTSERFERTRDQRLIHDVIIASVVRFVYGDLYGPNEIKIRKYNRISKVHAAIAFSAPRRFGKSMAIAIIVAILFMAVPGMEIIILAQGSRAAGKKAGMLGIIKEIIKVCFGEIKYDTDDKEHLIALIPDKRAIHAYSAKAGDGYVFPSSSSSSTVSFIYLFISTCAAGAFVYFNIFPLFRGFNIIAYERERERLITI